MLVNNQNNWKQRLNDFSIPDEELEDSNILWNRLQDRYKKPSKSRVKYFYWAAAVIVVVLLTSVFVSLNKQSKIFKDNPIVKTPELLRRGNVKIPPQVQEKTNFEVVENKSKEHEHLGRLVSKQNNEMVVIKTKELPQILIEPDLKSLSSRPSQTLKIQLPTATADLADSNAERKQMSIVHINKVNSAAEQEEIDQRHMLKIMRRYDVDVPPKNTTGMKEGFILKSFN